MKNEIEILKKIKTPYFLIDKRALEVGLERLRDSLESSWNNYIIGYSYKTNSLPWVIDFFNKNGCFAEVVSEDEFLLAESIGVKKEHIIYNGIAKSKDTFIAAINNGAIVNIDSEYEIEWLDCVKHKSRGVGIRVNFDLESFCPGQTQCGDEGERFGFCFENGELKRAIDRITRKGIRINGLHLHKSSKTRMPDVYKAIAENAVKIAMQYNLMLDYVDIGGGFFGGLEYKPQFIEYFDLVSSILRQYFETEKTKLIVEPGMALIGAPVNYITNVLDVKKTIRNTFIVTDGSRIHLDPLMSKNQYFYDIFRSEKRRNIIDRQVISGFTCMEHDRIFTLNDSEEIIPNDKIVYRKVGAYTMCLSPLFINWFPDVYVKDGERVYKVRERWTMMDYKSGSLLK